MTALTGGSATAAMEMVETATGAGTESTGAVVELSPVILRLRSASKGENAGFAGSDFAGSGTRGAGGTGAEAGILGALAADCGREIDGGNAPPPLAVFPPPVAG